MPKVSTYDFDSATAAAIRATGIRNARIELSASDILTLNSSPKQIIAAPGAGAMVQVLDVVVALGYGTTDYVLSESVSFQYGNVTDPTAQIAAPNILDYPENSVFRDSGLEGTASTTSYENRGVFLYSAANPTNGDSTLLVDISWRVIALP